MSSTWCCFKRSSSQQITLPSQDVERNHEQITSGTSTMFGRLLEESLDEETGVAKFVLWCVEAIKTTGDGLETDAIYRASGNQSRVQGIAKQKEISMQKTLDEEENIHVLTGLIKLFFRQLQNPLIDYDKKLFATCTRGIEKPDNRLILKTIKLMVDNMETNEYNTLAFMMKHLKGVLEHESTNKISIRSLGVIFGPTLMPHIDYSEDIENEIKEQSRIIEILLLEYDHIFPREARSHSNTGAINAFRQYNRIFSRKDSFALTGEGGEEKCNGTPTEEDDCNSTSKLGNKCEGIKEVEERCNGTSEVETECNSKVEMEKEMYHGEVENVSPTAAMEYINPHVAMAMETDAFGQF